MQGLVGWAVALVALGLTGSVLLSSHSNSDFLGSTRADQLTVLESVSRPRAQQVLGLQMLHEDVTHDGVKQRFLSKFNKVKAKFQAKKKDGLLNPLSGIKGLKKGKKLTAAQKAKIAAKMKALRQQILGDFASNTHFGKRVDCSYPYPAASCKGHNPRPIDPNQAMPAALGRA